MEKQEIFDLVLKYPNAQDLYQVIHSMAWDWHKNGKVKTESEKK